MSFLTSKRGSWLGAVVVMLGLAAAQPARADVGPEPDATPIDAGSGSGSGSAKKSGCSVAGDETPSGDAAWLFAAGATVAIVARRKKR